ncbi:uncharacterized protein A1O5_00351 [Cladophialophora psammophila CBS 110553]|uniref:Uncharacterized protein n=1 Tax=Cladophialophora psammophila CBS 110553 TaxID=1182543 RepID=W9Y042_9EURO|nr:uncharacterized protein A1O5_00351 [Cladophialophora psammophila CBS 110553]EXJ75844.1 hypothetical protein A1O5_00351 [Cladophialophora psammophila CBS 110553]
MRTPRRWRSTAPAANQNQDRTTYLCFDDNRLKSLPRNINSPDTWLDVSRISLFTKAASLLRLRSLICLPLFLYGTAPPGVVKLSFGRSSHL